MSRALVHLKLRLLGALLVIGLPLVTVAFQATVRRLVPHIVKGEHNDVARLTQMFGTLGGVVATTPAHEAFLADALARLNDVAEDRAERISVAEEGLLSILWAAIVIGAGSPWGSPCCSGCPTSGCTT